MKIKVVIQIQPDEEEQITIRCREITPEIVRLGKYLEEGKAPPKDIIVFLNGAEYILPLDTILFVESAGERSAVHTADGMYYSGKSLAELTGELGSNFFRVSRSFIVNMREISSLKRELSGICEAHFYHSDKTIYISRMYYKAFRDRLTELRCGN